MSKQEAIDLMKSSKSEDEWNVNCNTIKREFGGYPEWWFQGVIAAGLCPKSDIKVTVFSRENRLN